MSDVIRRVFHGRHIGVSDKQQLISRKGYVAGGMDRPSVRYHGPDTVAAFEDFLGTIDDTGKPFGSGQFRAMVGDTGHLSSVQTATNGVFRIFSTPSVGASKAAASGAGIGGTSLQWKGDQGRPGYDEGDLRYIARVALGSVSRASKRIHVFAGFTDIASFEYPAYDTGAGVISAAADYMGFMFSPGGDTGWSGVAASSTAGDSGDVVVALDTGVAVNVYDELELRYQRGSGDTGGSVTFYINGQSVGQIESPVVPTVAMTPVLVAFQQDTGGEYVDVDYIGASAPRDTGS